MKKVFLASMLLMLAAGCGKKSLHGSPPSAQGNYSHQLQVSDKNLMVEIATSSAAMQQGLSDRPSMQDNQGMLFDFIAASSTQEVYPAFWMKDMKFGLDFIWINHNKIISITPGVPAPANDNNLTNYFPPSKVTWVLEVNSGWAKKNDIIVGNDVYLK